MKTLSKYAAFFFAFMSLPLVLSCAEKKPDGINESRILSFSSLDDAPLFLSPSNIRSDITNIFFKDPGIQSRFESATSYELTNSYNPFHLDFINVGIAHSSIIDQLDCFDLEVFDHADLKGFSSRVKTRLPKYTEIIQETAQEYELDWRFIAALIYQESQFNPMAKGDTGVEGLMQLTYDTAQMMGIENRRDPVQNITAGIKYFDMLYKIFDEAEDPDRLMITLASYNAGPGHIFDARKIARERRLDPNSWDDLEKILPLLRYPEYYNKAKHGYCRGTEPVRYVKKIWTYYDLLKNQRQLKDIDEVES
ncbi:exported hypothetical protein [uncultured Desulfobacterium sp.]|uniref:Transglycosylase SLT domain-containing protein n=1 Tax=uncultured Desulfobacterium sp. TaxID=201089 RepID=A0A445N1F7_9BACT|nr:exported hypothetical protein [uncultured Desulfobacterium sp.]